MLSGYDPAQAETPRQQSVLYWVSTANECWQRIREQIELTRDPGLRRPTWLKLRILSMRRDPLAVVA